MPNTETPSIEPGQPVVLARPEHAISRKLIDHDTIKVLYRLHRNGFRSLLVGGSVRDMLLGRDSHDLDFGLPGGALAVARRIANKIGAAYYPLDSERCAARLVLIHEDGTREILDFAVTKAGYDAPHRNKRKLTGISIGKGHISFKMYDKPKEIRQQSKKFWMYAVWKLKNIPRGYKMYSGNLDYEAFNKNSRCWQDMLTIG